MMEEQQDRLLQDLEVAVFLFERVINNNEPNMNTIAIHSDQLNYNTYRTSK